MILKRKILLLSLTVGIIYILPHILFTIEMKGNYKIFFAPEDGESEVYTGRIREVYDGHYYISDPYIYENKSKPHFRSYFSELILGFLGKTFHLPILKLLILNNFMFPAVLFLLIFYFLFILTKSPNFSLLGSSFILLTEFPEIILHFIKGTYIELIFSRGVNPAFNFIFFILCVILTYMALRSLRPLHIFFSAVSFGLVFYTDPYFWSYLTVSCVLLSGYLIFKKNFRELKVLMFIILVGLIISIPYWINLIRLLRLPYFSELITRMALYHTHEPLLAKLPIIGILLFVFFYKNRDFNFYFILSFLIGGFLCMNQQVITGRDIESWHWYHYMVKQMVIMAVFILAHNLFQRFNYKKSKKLFLITSFTMFIVISLYIQIFYYQKAKTEQKERQLLYDAFLWLNDNTEVDSVVLASDNVSLILPVDTHNNVYTVRWICESVVSNYEMMERFFLFARIFGMDEDAIIKYIRAYPFICFGWKPNDPKYKDYDDFFQSNRVFEMVSKKYKYFVQKDILGLLKKYRVDYIFYSPYERKISKVDLNKYLFLDKAYDKDNIQIYKINR